MDFYRREEISKLIFLQIIVFVFTIFSINCGGKPYIKQEDESIQQKSESIPKVILGAGDVLEIKFFYTPELNETQTVRPDGKISLQLVGEVEVTGKTPFELKDELIKLFSTKLNNPDITVIVRSLYSHRVYVGGEVNAPGFLEKTRHMTALEAIMEAGGFNLNSAKVRNVVIVRYKGDKRYGYKLNLKPALEGKSDTPFFLEPYDIVYIPRTKITAVNQWLDQYIDGVIPNTVLPMIPLWTQYMMYLEYREVVKDR